MNTVELSQDLIKIPSISGNFTETKRCIDYCKNYFKNFNNVKIKEIEINNTPSILLSNYDGLDFDIISIGHIDVVPVEDNKMFIPEIKDGKLYGRGSYDMKSLVAVSMKMLEYVLKNNFKYKFGILIVSDEEIGGGNGAKYWAEELKLKSKIILDFDDGSDLNILTKRRKGSLMLKLTSKGLSAHGSMPWLGIDANENLINTLVNIRKYFPYVSRENPIDNEWITTFHTGIFKGGEAMNTICPEAIAKVDFRITEDWPEEKILEIVKNSVVGNIEIEKLVSGKVVSTDLNNNFVKMYVDCIKEETKKDVSFGDRTGGTDCRYFVNGDTVIIQHGPNGFGIHSNNEYVEIESLEKFENIQKGFLGKLTEVEL